jgi:hypothetical protein
VNFATGFMRDAWGFDRKIVAPSDPNVIDLVYCEDCHCWVTQSDDKCNTCFGTNLSASEPELG